MIAVLCLSGLQRLQSQAPTFPALDSVSPTVAVRPQVPTYLGYRDALVRDNSAGVNRAWPAWGAIVGLIAGGTFGFLEAGDGDKCLELGTATDDACQAVVNHNRHRQTNLVLSGAAIGAVIGGGLGYLWSLHER